MYAMRTYELVLKFTFYSTNGLFPCINRRGMMVIESKYPE